MKNIRAVIVLIILFGCKEKSSDGKFTVNGHIKNIPANTKVYLEEIYFNNQEPTVIDTAVADNGKFHLKGMAHEQGLYRVRVADLQYFVINDADELEMNADYSNKLAFAEVSSPANASLKKLLQTNDSLRDVQKRELAEKEMLQSGTDSLVKAKEARIDSLKQQIKNFLASYADTTQYPVIGIIALGYTSYFSNDEMKEHLSALTKRFPQHTVLKAIAANFNKSPEAVKPQPEQSADMAPEITMPDTSGKPVSLSSFRGKYVLVDFWASWCGPCRGENPNVVAAFNKYKDKNFTVLGVSLDRDKTSWLKAIHQDHLTWTHISDLKFWDSQAVTIYGFDAIPYNVLVDPQGKIIAKELRGEDLEHKLAEVLK